jgi:hypothetical protein
MKTRIVLIGAVVLGWAVCAQATTITYNAATDFSASSNPNGVWSYGTISSSVPFSAFTTGRTWVGRSPSLPGIDGWDNGIVGVDAGYDPSVTHNSTTGSISAFGFTWPENALALDSYGSSENSGYPDVRWTAPTARVIDISATFTDIRDVPGDFATAYVRVNGGGFQSLGLANSTDISWSNTGMEVLAGDTIDFLAVGATVTMLQATISQTVVPEPSSMVLLAASLLGLLAYAWRKRR